MLPAERRKNIMSLLYQNGSVAVTDLSLRFHVSEETVRRDLVQLENEGLLTRFYGGAFLGDIVRETVPFQLRKDAEREAKVVISEKCMQQIHSGDTLFLDSSTTALYVAERMAELQNITVITNAHAIVTALSECKDIRVIAIGGELDHQLLSYFGWSSLDTISHYHADKAFVSCTGISMENGITDSNDMEGRMRYWMLKNAQKRYLIADSTKFGKTTLVQIADCSLLDAVICDKDLSHDWLDYMASLQIKVL